MLSAQWQPCWSHSGLGLRFSDAVLFWFFLSAKQQAFLVRSSSGSRLYTCAALGRGNDELQRGPVPEESAGGLRADPADRKRHIRRCVQGKTWEKTHCGEAATEGSIIGRAVTAAS